MFVIHGRCSNKSATFGYSYVTDISLQFLSKNCFVFETVGIPYDKTRPSSHLSRCHKSFGDVDVKTGDIIIVGGVDPHSIFGFIENNSAGGSVIDDFSLRVVSDVVSSIVAPVTIDVVYL